MDLEQLIAALVNFPDAAALRQAIKDRPNVKTLLYQPFFNDGHGVATAEAKSEKEGLDARVTAAERKVQDAEQKLADWKKDNPDAAAVREQYESQIAKLQQEHKDALDAREKADQQKEVGRAVKALESVLIAKGVHPVHAKALVKDDAVLNRIQPDKKAGVRLLQPDASIPYAESEFDKALDLMAEGIKEKVEPDFIVSTVGRGSGRGTTTGSSGASGGGKDGEVFDEVRDEVARKFGRDTDDDGESRQTRASRDRRSAQQRLNERLGVRTR